MSGDGGALRNALQPLLEVIGGEIIEVGDMEPGDVPIEMNGEPALAVRVLGLDGALDRMVQQIETELGAPLPSLGRVEKQRAIRLLDERGAFLLRRSIDDVADLMGVSRITIYNYLNTMRD